MSGGTGMSVRTAPASARARFWRATLRFSLADDAVPLLTTKRVFWKAAAREMLWFLSGETNIRPLAAQGVSIWTDWPLDKYRKATGEEIGMTAFEARIVADADFAARWGDLGPVYGKQWVDWPHYEPAPGGWAGPLSQGRKGSQPDRGAGREFAHQLRGSRRPHLHGLECRRAGSDGTAALPHDLSVP